MNDFEQDRDGQPDADGFDHMAPVDGWTVDDFGDILPDG